MSRPSIVQIVGFEAGLVNTLSAVVSTVRDCVSKASDWLGDSPGDLQIPGNVFQVFIYVNLECPSSYERVYSWLSARSSGDAFPRIILVADHSGSQAALKLQQQLMRLDIAEILERPINLQRIRYLIESRKIEYNFWLKKQQRAGLATDQFCEVQRRMRKVAEVDTNVLLSGETGVGKTWWANWIHCQSPRRSKPFVVVNCGNFSPTLVESQLFGHAKGAFTGADRKQMGQFGYAGQGTIFLDEIDTLPGEIQAKLLRVVENREFRPLGENKTVPMKARIISASNRELDDLVEQGEFRADLVFRLNAYEIRIPPLRERTSQIERFCKFFSEDFARQNKRKPVTIQPAVLKTLERYSWPGNLRELRNCIQYAAIDSDDGIVHIDNLPRKLLQKIAQVQSSDKPGVRSDNFQSVDISNAPAFDLNTFKEVRRLIDALARNDYNRSKTARELGVSRMTVYNMMKRHDLG